MFASSKPAKPSQFRMLVEPRSVNDNVVNTSWPSLEKILAQFHLAALLCSPDKGPLKNALFQVSATDAGAAFHVTKRRSYRASRGSAIASDETKRKLYAPLVGPTNVIFMLLTVGSQAGLRGFAYASF